MTPVRLSKNQPDSDYRERMNTRIEAWVITHATFFLAATIIMLLIIFVLLIYAMIGVSATESGIQYNQFQNII